jgi:hypothetical protein
VVARRGLENHARQLPVRAQAADDGVDAERLRDPVDVRGLSPTGGREVERHLVADAHGQHARAGMEPDRVVDQLVLSERVGGRQRRVPTEIHFDGRREPPQVPVAVRAWTPAGFPANARSVKASTTRILMSAPSTASPRRRGLVLARPRQ